MDIRLAHTNDLDSIKKLYWESDNYHYNNLPNIYSETKEPFRQEEYLSDLIKEEKSIFYVIEVDSDVVGFIYGYEESKGFLPIHKKRTYFYIDNIVVSSRYHRTGYGRMLLNKIISDCKERGYSDIMLNVYNFNKKAISLYQDIGFKDLSRDMILEL